MKWSLLLVTVCFSLLLVNCKKSQQDSESTISPTAFSEKIKQTPQAQILDVRTPEEYAEGHLADAINMDWEGTGFEAKTSILDKTKPVFVYCQGGGRGSAAAKKLRTDGFKEVYNLDGGLSNWEDAKLPVTKE